MLGGKLKPKKQLVLDNSRNSQLKMNGRKKQVTKLHLTGYTYEVSISTEFQIPLFILSLLVVEALTETGGTGC